MITFLCLWKIIFWKSKIELKIAMKTWDIFQMKTQLLCLQYADNYIKYFETRTKHLLCRIKRGAFD